VDANHAYNAYSAVEVGRAIELEFDRNPSPLRDELACAPIRFEHGVVRIPEGPGLGIAINQGVLKRYRIA
jgi:D-galactarolactone cycloisomerase